MSASIDFCTPGRWRAHKRFASEPPFGLISLHAGRLYSSRRDGRVEHDHDVGDRWQAQDVCAAWQRILADPTRPDPSAWHYTPPGDG